MPTVRPTAMHPVLFEIPGIGFPIRSFGVLVAGGMFLGIWLMGRLLRKYGDDPEEDPLRASQVAVWIVIGILVGARLMYVAVESARYLSTDVSEAADAYLSARFGGPPATTPLGPEELGVVDAIEGGYGFVHDPVRILLIWKGGLVMYGGLLGAVLLGMWSSRKNGLSVWNALDTAMIGGFFGLMVGRWGCLLVGDDFGTVVSEGFQGLPFPLTITVPTLAWLNENPQSLFPREHAGATLWATQVWMSVNAVIVGLVGWWVLSRRTWKGQAMAVMVVHYSITRFLIEMYRGDEIRGVWFGGALSTSQLVSIAGLALGIYLLVKRPGPRVEPAAA